MPAAGSLVNAMEPLSLLFLRHRLRLHHRERRAGRILQHAEATNAGNVGGVHRDGRAELLGPRDRRVSVVDRDVGEPVRAR